MTERITLLTDEERAWLEDRRAAQGQPLPPLWYEQFIAYLVKNQQESETLLVDAAESYKAIVTHLTGLADEFAKLGEVATGLAESVPSGDQAAADLGTAVDRHLVANVHTVLSGEVARLSDDVAALRQFIEEDRARASEERRRILQALGAHDTTTTTRPEGP